MHATHAVKEAVATGLADSSRFKVADALNQLLADEFTLYVKARSFHWNVAGSDFAALHRFFQERYEALDEDIDATAERARALGARAAGALSRFLREATLQESPATLDARGMLAAYLADTEALCRSLRAKIDLADKAGDPGTADHLTGLLAAHEKAAWMTRAHLE